MKRWKTIRKWRWRIVLAGFTLAVILSVIGWFWERSEHHAFAEAAFTPPGQMMSVADHELHANVEGEGHPGVLLIAGLGEDLRTWQQIQGRLAEVTRVVSYDRPGLGWSPPRKETLSIDEAVEDIASLLSAPDLFEGPPVLVGHSLGGVIARQFAYMHPLQVAGLVLLDPPPPGKMPVLANVMNAVFLGVKSWQASVGWRRWQYYRKNPQLTREEALRGAHLDASASRAREARREFKGAVDGEAFVPPRDGLGTLPLTLFIATQAPPGFSGMLEEMNAAKRLMAQESERGKTVELGTTHYVHYENPDTVVAEVLAMLKSVSSTDGSAPAGNPRRN